MVRLLGAFHELTDGTAETFRVASRPTGARNETQTSGLFAAGSPNDHCQLLLLHGPRSHVMLEDVLKHAGLEMSAGHSTRPPTLPSLTLTLEYFRRLQVKPPRLVLRQKCNNPGSTARCEACPAPDKQSLCTDGSWMRVLSDAPLEIALH
ncbi:hypothetical protein CDEST_04759 [Colletotrichum destructivum]|uniref:Uncharacterized protein n=1 Tax=Colletotrichum destructivum TaxID=34406 RepID=A0AAX4I8U5_9PEZI|nr:hypothetical protein CDEST_04759 [Colletotrichum destructivum]